MCCSFGTDTKFGYVKRSLKRRGRLIGRISHRSALESAVDVRYALPVQRSHRSALRTAVDVRPALPRPEIASGRPGDCCGRASCTAPPRERIDALKRGGRLIGPDIASKRLEDCCWRASRPASPRDGIKAPWGLMWTCILPSPPRDRIEAPWGLLLLLNNNEPS